MGPILRSRVGTVMRRSSTSWTIPGLPNSTPPSDDAIPYSGPLSPDREHEGFITSLKQLDTTPPTQLTTYTIPESPAHESVALAVETHEDLLTALAEKGAVLPPNFKFLVTCRPDVGVCAAFEVKSHALQMHLEIPHDEKSRRATYESVSPYAI